MKNLVKSMWDQSVGLPTGRLWRSVCGRLPISVSFLIFKFLKEILLKSNSISPATTIKKQKNKFNLTEIYTEVQEICKLECGENE